jgi:hypothetical protein
VKKLTKKQKNMIEIDPILLSMKKRYFTLAVQENYPKTKDITDTLNNLERKILKRKNEILEEILASVG